MNGKTRLELAATHKHGLWDVTDVKVDKITFTQDFVSDELELFIQVTYSGYTVKGAKLWDFSGQIVTNAENGVFFQKLTAADRDKAGRIEDVLLGNSRRF